MFSVLKHRLKEFFTERLYTFEVLRWWVSKHPKENNDAKEHADMSIGEIRQRMRIAASEPVDDADYTGTLSLNYLEEIKTLIRRMPYGDTVELAEAIATDGDVQGTANNLWRWANV